MQVNKKVLAPSPKTTQGFASCFKVSQDGKWLGYCTKNTAVLRSMENLADSKAYTKCTNEVTAIAFDPKGEIAAIGDAKGNVKTFSIEKLKTDKEFNGALIGKINGLDFSPDGKKLLVYGESKQIYGKVIVLDTGKEDGDLSNNHKNVLAGCFSKGNNCSVMLGGEECVANFYGGSPLSFKCTLKEHAVQKFVTTIKSTPDGSKFVSTGFDKKLVFYNSEDGKVVDQIDATKVTNGHKMTIMGLDFLDDDRFVTASYDKTVKVWSLKDKKVLFTLIPKEGKNLDKSFMMCGVGTNGKKIVSVSLSGLVFAWNVDTLADNKLPDQCLNGHQGPLTYVALVKSTKELVSADSLGKVLLWPENDCVSKLVVSKEQKVVKVATSLDDSLIYVLFINGDVFGYSRDKCEEKLKVVGLGGQGYGLCPSRKTNDLLFILTHNCLAKVSKGQVAKKVSFSDGCALEINEDAGEVLVGDEKGKLHVLDMDLKEKSKNEGTFGEPTVIALSPDGKLLAMADNKGIVNVFKADTKEEVNKYQRHNSRIFDLEWGADSKLIITGSLDFCVLVWNNEAKNEVKRFENLNDNQINSVRLVNDKEFVCCGTACTLERIAFQ